MSSNAPREQPLLAEVEDLRARLEEAEEALRAIRAGEVDALVVESATGPKIFTLQGLDAESNRFRGDLLAQVSDAVIVVDAERRLTYLNAAAERQYGVVAAEVVGLPLSRIYETRWLHARDEATALASLAQTGHWRGEVIHVLGSGATLHVESSVTRLNEENDTGPGLIAVIRDVTQEHSLRVIAQQQQDLMKQSEGRLRRVLDQLFVLVGVLDLEGHVVDGNAAPLRRAGIHSKDVMGRPFWECHWWNHDSAVSQQVRQGVQQAARGETVRFDIRGQFAGGQLLTVDLQLAPLRDEGGRITNVIASSVDVESRVAALRELELSRAEAVASARRLDALHRTAEATLEAAPVGIALADPQGRLSQINRAGAELMGIAGAADPNMAIRSLQGWQHTPGAQEGVPLRPDQWPLQRALRERRTVTSIVEIAPVDGVVRRRTVLMSSAPVLDATGNVIGGVVVQVDISQRIEAEAALRNADRLKDEFLATLAHELRNPLAPIRMAVELIRRREPADATVLRARVIIERQVMHLSRLVDDLLDVSRITRGTIHLRQETVDLGAVAASAIESVRMTVEEAGLALEEHIAPPPALVRGDATRLAQCIVNLLNNAVKFTRRGGRIALRIAREGAMAVVEVSDTGTGISASNLERIFELFMQEHPSGFGGNSGLGIGLALTRKLVQLHGGTITAASAGPGMGSTFRIELPAVGATATQQRPTTRPALEGVGASVLIVDDNRDAADTLAEMLAMSGFSIASEYTGEAAVRAISEQSPDAVLLDIGLPDIDGYEVCRRIRGSGSSKQPVVIAMTGWGQDKDRDLATAAGFNGHLTKPAEPDRILAMLQDLLVRRN